MDKTVKLSTFPSNNIEALTMLYLKQQDLKLLSPEEILELYDTTYAKISEKHKENRKERNKIIMKNFSL